jgi:inositol-pentakisphosphate 2-kinase
MDPAFLQLPPQLFDDSASNYGSSVAGDCFDDDFLSDTGRESPSNAGSLAEDSDDEAVPAISSDDMVRLRDMSSYRCRDHKCDCTRDNNRDGDRTRTKTQDASTRDRGHDAAPALDMNNSSDVCHPPLVSVSLLPRGTKPVRLVGEGAANAVFEIKVPPNSRMDAQFQGTSPPFFFFSLLPSKAARDTNQGFLWNPTIYHDRDPKAFLNASYGYTDPVPDSCC